MPGNLIHRTSQIASNVAAPATLEADWQLRSGQDASSPQPGVVWFHDFRSAAEVNAFRFTGGFSGGNDPLAQGVQGTNVRHITNDGMASGSCLECLHPAGSGANSVWWRPFSPLVAPGNGKSTNDPGANGTITPRAWAPTSGSSDLANHDKGWYGNALYANADPTHFDGTEFYCQLVVKMDPNRITGGNNVNKVGKFIWFTQARTGSSFEPAEHVFYSYGDGGNQGTDKNYLRCYVARAGGTNPLEDDDPGTRVQVNSDISQDWYWTGGWDCVLINIRVGQANVATGTNSTRLRVWAARNGETSYTKIWDQEYALTNFPNGSPYNGIQSFIASAYNNNFTFPQGFFHRYAQIIFSKNTIPCPQIWPSTSTAPTWFNSQSDKTWGTVATTGTIASVAPSPDPGGITGQAGVITEYSGGMVDTNRQALCVFGGGHGGYYGNEWYRCLLNTATPSWQRISNPRYSFGSGNRMDDNSPRATHSLGHLVYEPSSDLYYLTAHAYYASNGDTSNQMFSFNPTTGVWTQKNGQAQWADNAFVDGGGVYDPVTGHIFRVSTVAFSSVSEFNPATNTDTLLNGGNLLINRSGASVALSPSRRIIVAIRQDGFRFLDITNSTTIALGWRAPAAESGTPTNVGAPGFVWHETSGKFLLWQGGATIRTLTIPSNVSSGTWVWGTVSGVSGAASGEAIHEGGTHTWGRFGLLTNFAGSGRDFVMVINGVTEPIYFLKLPVGGV